jgi:hypothetical protein
MKAATLTQKDLDSIGAMFQEDMREHRRKDSEMTRAKLDVLRSQHEEFMAEVKSSREYARKQLSEAFEAYQNAKRTFESVMLQAAEKQMERDLEMTRLERLLNYQLPSADELAERRRKLHEEFGKEE